MKTLFLFIVYILLLGAQSFCVFSKSSSKFHHTFKTETIVTSDGSAEVPAALDNETDCSVEIEKEAKDAEFFETKPLNVFRSNPIHEDRPYYFPQNFLYSFSGEALDGFSSYLIKPPRSVSVSA